MNLSLSLVLLATLLSMKHVVVHSQQQARKTTLVISQDANGLIRVADNNNGKNTRLIDTNGQVVEGETEGDMDEQVVAGLLEWLEEKKRKKKEKKEEKENKNRPLIKPERFEKKEIHIHINNNHFKKNEKHKKHDNHKKHGKYYEDYHDGHYGHDYHDKHYHGKHSWPLLGHHYYGGADHHDHHHTGGHHGDDYGAYESQKVSKYVAKRKPIAVERPVLVAKKRSKP